MSSKIFSAATVGLDGEIVEVEVDVLKQGLHNFTIVGLPDMAIKESKERVSSALKNSGFDPPFRWGRITVNLAPADLPKVGPIYDLPIALGFILASKQAFFDFRNRMFIGELALDGMVRPIHGTLPLAILAKEKGFQELYVPRLNAPEASAVRGIKIIPVDNLFLLISHLTGGEEIEYYPESDFAKIFDQPENTLDMVHVQGQEFAKRALEIAAAGGHNVILNGPPGSGKTLLARIVPTILPKLDFEEALEITKIFSVAGKLPKDKGLLNKRPFRSPHHSASAVSLIGGGTVPKPGEISLAHRGVLFLDEFAEFPRHVLENLRQPLEDGVISVSRAKGTLDFPARFILIAAMNPCPCGNATDPERLCSCTPSQIIKYQKKISGPILDRIDLHVEVPRLKFEKMQGVNKGERSLDIRQRVEKARAIQRRRFANLKIFTNSELNAELIKEFCVLDSSCLDLLRSAVSSLKLSARAYHRIIKISRTIADLSGEEKIDPVHIAEAVQYRFKTE